MMSKRWFVWKWTVVPDKYGITLHSDATRSSPMYARAVPCWTDIQRNDTEKRGIHTAEKGRWTGTKRIEFSCHVSTKTRWILVVLQITSPAQRDHHLKYIPQSKDDDCVDFLGEATWISTKNSNSRYWPNPIAKKNRDKLCSRVSWALIACHACYWVSPPHPKLFIVR